MQNNELNKSNFCQENTPTSNKRKLLQERLKIVLTLDGVKNLKELQKDIIMTNHTESVKNIFMIRDNTFNKNNAS